MINRNNGKKINWRAKHSADILVHLTVWGPVRHLRVWRDDGKDGIGWDILQAAKNDLIGESVCMVEFYPEEHRVVNKKNMRHLWEIPSEHSLPIGFKARH